MEWKDAIGALVCPACRRPLVLTGSGDGLRCAACRLVFPVRDGIPVLLVDQAQKED